MVIPVLNEAERINQVIEHIYRLNGDDIEIIVSDGAQGGTTISCIADGRVIKVISEKGRGKQMNVGVAASTGDILLFLHADTLLPLGAFEKITAAMKSVRYAGGAFNLGIDSDRIFFRLIELAVAFRTRLTRIPYGDQAIFVRKEIFQGLGGFRDFPVMEDVELMRAIKGSGQRILIISPKVRTSPRRWEKEGIVYCTLRNWMLIALYLAGMSPDKLAKFYSSR